MCVCVAHEKTGHCNIAGTSMFKSIVSLSIDSICENTKCFQKLIEGRSKCFICVLSTNLLTVSLNISRTNLTKNYELIRHKLDSLIIQCSTSLFDFQIKQSITEEKHQEGDLCSFKCLVAIYTRKRKWVFVSHLVDAQRIQDANHIINKILKVGLFRLRWLVGESIAPEIESNCSVAFVCGSNHLVAPCIPYFWKSM